MKQLISIIIPIYDTPFEFVNKAVYSALNQTYDNIEIIIVDDGSKKEYVDFLTKAFKNKKIDIIKSEHVVFLMQEILAS